MLGENREIFIPKLKKAQMMTFDAIAVSLLKEYGYDVVLCDSDEEALRKAADFVNDDRRYPVHFSISDTSGEKTYEEFYTDAETVDMERFESLGVIVGKQIPEKEKIDRLFEELSRAFGNNNTTKQNIVEILSSYLPDFEHLEKGKSLDRKM